MNYIKNGFNILFWNIKYYLKSTVGNIITTIQSQLRVLLGFDNQWKKKENLLLRLRKRPYKIYEEEEEEIQEEQEEIQEEEEEIQEEQEEIQEEQEEIQKKNNNKEKEI